MIINSEKSTLELGNMDNNENKMFNIKQNKRMFEILSSNIYSDKITAILREYGCNALDSHIAAGKVDVPFTVHLPNQIEPWVSIRDYGIGLSHEQVMELYTTYGDSTKSTSNDFVGALGLGSKCAFAYTDQFSVTSWFEGRKRMYSAYVNEEGTPCIMLLSEEETEECNGLEIYIAVDSEDYHLFADKAARVFFRFPVLPEITGNIIDLPKVKYVIETPLYKVRERNNYRSDYNTTMAVQGPIAYPINVNSLDNLSSEDKEFLQNVPMDIHFPLGSLNIAVSREALSYDKATKANIAEVIEKVKSSIVEEYSVLMADCESLFQAKILFRQMEDNCEGIFSHRVLKKLVSRQVMFDGKVVSDAVLDFSAHDTYYEQYLMPITFTDKPKKKKDKANEETFQAYTIYTINAKPYGRKNLSWTKLDCLTSNSKVIFIDTEIANYRVLTDTIWNSGFLSNRTYNMLLIVKPIAGQDLDKLSKEVFFGMPYEKFSNLQIPDEDFFAAQWPTPKVRKPAVKRAKAVYPANKVRINNSSSGYTTTKENVESDQEIYYFSTFRDSVICPYTDQGILASAKINPNLDHKFKAAIKYGLLKDIEDKLYIINSSDKVTLKKAKNCHCVFEYIDKKVEKLNTKQFQKLLITFNTYYDYVQDDIHYFKSKGKWSTKHNNFKDIVNNEIPRNSKYKKILLKLKDCQTELNQHIKMPDILEQSWDDKLFDFLFYKTKSNELFKQKLNLKSLHKLNTKLKADCTEASKEYPLLRFYMYASTWRYDSKGSYNHIEASYEDLKNYLLKHKL